MITTIIGLILNSLSCVLSYNYYDYKALLKEDGKKKVLHESTLVRQTLYFCLFFILLLSLTVATLVSMDHTKGLTLVDQFGKRKVLTATFCYKLLGIGWASFILAWIINIVFYCVHPSKVSHYLGDDILFFYISCFSFSVDVHPKRLHKQF